jgi:DNA modification methylase
VSPRKEVIGDCTLWLGDCREVLAILGPVDAVVTDPPYGIGENAHRVASRGKLAKTIDYGSFDWDVSTPDKDVIDAVVAKARHAVIFGGNYFHLPPSRCWLVWDKLNGSNDFADCELAWTNLDKAVRRLTFRSQGMLTQPGCRKEPRVHPTQKPEPVMRWALLQAPDSATVLDPFMGSGTTLVAAKRLGKRAVGIEREERYVAAAIERLGQSALPLEIGA